ncbi:hypothetical protein [Desulfosoma caldarium]|uniref:Uncharacterized protein n=1 Tax=Desulfosoma caldarium TaxID=610254 RepID=A0A3N1UPZ0_9BACT|nr:hypothetical protein [Desulfosoma caldarium]ROQ93202.1 hypothetical protein EDC27_1208 [Desulfosoma caldarium]
MDNVVFLDQMRRQKLASRAFRLWRRLFSGDHPWNEKTRWQDLTHSMLLRFASEDQNAQKALYDLIMVTQGLGDGDHFTSVNLETLCRLLNGYFYLTDQARFEIMARLDWVQRSPRMERPILDMACDPSIYETEALWEIPPLCPRHPEYEKDWMTKGMERSVLVRKAIPQALQQLRAMAQNPVTM